MEIINFLDAGGSNNDIVILFILRKRITVSCIVEHKRLSFFKLRKICLRITLSLVIVICLSFYR